MVLPVVTASASDLRYVRYGRRVTELPMLQPYLVEMMVGNRDPKVNFCIGVVDLTTTPAMQTSKTSRPP